MARLRKPLLILLGLVAGLCVVAVLGHQLVLRQLQTAVLASLGPRATVASLSIDRGGVEMRELRVAAERSGPLAWPAEDELRASRVRVVPQWRALWPALWAVLSSNPAAVWRVARIEVDDAYVSVLRTRQGQLRLLPSVLETPPRAATLASGLRLAALQTVDAPALHLAWVAEAQARAAAAPPPPGTRQSPPGPAAAVHIGQVLLNRGAIDFFDASVARPAHRLQLLALQAEVGPLDWPALDQPVPLSLQARLKGRGPRAAVPGEDPASQAADGLIQLNGQLTPATRDAQIKARFTGVDLRVLQPYLLKVNEGGVERGRLDLALDATVRQQRLHAPGTVVLTDLALARNSSFAGMPQQLVVAAMRQQGRIELRFTLDGRLDDPNFSVNENLATRIAVGLAESLGVSVGGAVEGLGGLIKGLFGK